MPNAIETQECRFCTMVCWDIGWIIIYLSATHCWELMKWVGHSTSHCYLWWRAMVWHFMSNSHKVKTACIVVLPSHCCHGDFSAMILENRRLWAVLEGGRDQCEEKSCPPVTWPCDKMDWYRGCNKVCKAWPGSPSPWKDCQLHQGMDQSQREQLNSFSLSCLR